MKLKIYQVDAFTDTVFKGNYAAVMLLEEWLPAELMQSIATENNVSETAFVVNTEANVYAIRWFSPLAEIDFCGHATLATAFVLFNADSALEEVVFSAEAVGRLPVLRGADGEIAMRFPNRKPDLVEQVPEALLSSLSVTPDAVYRNTQAYYAVLPEESMVYDADVDLDQVRKLAPYDLVVTAASSEYDFISRYFWPVNGGDEDPVTGSAHTALAPLWAERLGKDSLVAFQASSRGGLLNCQLEGDQVILSGKAVQYLEGYIDV